MKLRFQHADQRPSTTAPGASRPGPLRRAGGFVLFAVLVFVLLLAMVVASLLFQASADESAASASAGSEQAWCAALSGVAELLRVAPTAGGPEPDWQDDPRRFRHQLVYDDGADRWYFTAFHPAPPDSLVELRYGLADAASRLDARQSTEDQLARLPQVTPDLARRIRQAFGEGPTLAAPATSASTNSPDSAADLAAEIPADPLASVADPAAVESAASLGDAPALTARSLTGEDVNRNGRLDPAEDANANGNLDRGLAEYLTLDAADADRTSEGRPRIQLNNPEAGLPEGINLPPAFTNFLAELRTSKVKLDHPADALDATITVKSPQGVDTPVASGIGADELPLVLEHFTARSADARPALVNVNTASAHVLATLPGIDLSLAESIVSTRTALAPDRRKTPAWLLQEGTLTPEQFKAVAPHLTARSYQFECRVAGYGLPSGRFRVLDVAIDTSSGRPVVTRLVDVTRLGFPLLPENSDEPGTPGLTSDM